MTYARIPNGRKKLLNCAKYYKNLKPNVHILVFWQATKVNGAIKESMKIVYF
jgi:hypothetical protein